MRWGSTQYGAFYGAFLIFLVCARILRVSWLFLMDLACPTAAIVIAIGRIGCYAANCCTGIPLARDWWMPSFMPYRDHFPASLVTALVNFGIAAVLMRRPVDAKRPGGRVGLYLILSACERFMIEFVREGDTWWGGLTLVQWLALPLIGIGFAFMRGWPLVAFERLKGLLSRAARVAP
jgi:phosphatidylglycerol:prolipoprotein diacylglycerol transferase